MFKFHYLKPFSYRISEPYIVLQKIRFYVVQKIISVFENNVTKFNNIYDIILFVNLNVELKYH
jgi:hypothetical protein